MAEVSETTRAANMGLSLARDAKRQRGIAHAMRAAADEAEAEAAVIDERVGRIREGSKEELNKLAEEVGHLPFHEDVTGVGNEMDRLTKEIEEARG